MRNPLIGQLNFMLDLETYGINPGCAIAEIGIVCFDHEKILRKKQLTLSLKDQLKAGLKIEEKCLREFIFEQKNKFSYLGTMPFKDAVMHLRAFVHQNFPNPPIKIWSHGAGFDLPILKYAIEAFDSKPIWHGKEERCTRTVFELFPDFVRRVNHHQALDDAENQALDLMDVCKQIEFEL